MEEKSIIRSIFIVPIAMVVVSLLIVSGVFYYLVKDFEESQLKTSLNEILSSKKELLKSQIDGINKDIKLDILMLEDRVKRDLKSDVDIMADVIEEIYQKTHSFDLVNSLIEKINKKRGDKYFFLFQKDSGVILIHPIKKFIGVSGKDIKRGPFTAYELANQAMNNREREGAFEMNFYKATDPKHLFKKIVWVKELPGLNWVLGSGEYVDTLRKVVRKEVIKKILLKKYGNGHYFFILDMKNNVAFTPLNTFYMPFKDVIDIKGNHFVERMVKIAKEGGGFVKYWWFNPVNGKVEEKISYVKYNKCLNLIVGTGLYTSELNNFIEKDRERIDAIFKKLNSTFTFILLLMIAVSLLISMLISNRLKNIFKSYNDKLKLQKERAEFLAIHDPLTKTYNRNAFNEKIKEEFELFKRYKNKFSMCLLDLDHFKKINDTFGHDVGDDVLRSLVNFLSKHIRKADFLARWGGEEFIIIFPETDAKKAYKKCLKLKEELKKMDKPVDFTFSAGVTEIEENDTIDSLFKKVDIALYKAKENGRDRVEILI